MKKNLGFTLIELLVVVSIISLLSSIVLAAVTDARDKAKGTAFRQHVEEFKKAIELYKLDHDGELTETETITSINNDGYYGNSEDRFEVFKKYIDEFPMPPFDESSGRFIYVPNYPSISPNSCNGSKKFLLVIGQQNIKYFDDWYVWSSTNPMMCLPI